MLAKNATDDTCRRNFRIIFLLVLRVKAYLCCFTQLTVDQSKLTVNGSVLSDTPNVRYLIALYLVQNYAATYYNHSSMHKVHLVKGHVVYMYWIDTVYVQNNLPTELVEGQFS